MSTILSTILYVAFIILDVQISSLKLNKSPVAKVTEMYEDNPMFPSHLGLEYVPGSDGLQVRVNLDYQNEEPNQTDENLKHYEWKSRMLVAPAHKFAFCYIEKVGCTQFNLLMNRINGITEGKVWWRSTYDKYNLDFKDITRENGWFKGIFLREPQHRFLSAFNSKCLPHHDNDPGMCIIRALSPKNFNMETAKLSFHEATTYLEKTYRSGNPHFDPMKSFCGGLSEDLLDYDYVGHLDNGYADVQRQVSEMLGKRNITFEAAFETIFPSSKPTANKHTTGTTSEFEEFYSDADKEHVKNYYASDYALLSTLDSLRK